MPLHLQEKLYSVKEAAQMLGVTAGRIRQLVIEQRIKAFKIANVLVLPSREVERYASERRPYRRSKNSAN